MANSATTSLLASLQDLNAPQLRRLLVEHLTQQKVGLYWEANAIARDAALIRLAQGAALPQDWPARIARAAAAPLPISAADLMPDLTGPAVGQGLKAAERAWIASGFNAPRAALIAAARQSGGSVA